MKENRIIQNLTIREGILLFALIMSSKWSMKWGTGLLKLKELTVEANTDEGKSAFANSRIALPIFCY